MITKQDQLRRAMEMLEIAMDLKFYGKFVLSLEAGNIVQKGMWQTFVDEPDGILPIQESQMKKMQEEIKRLRTDKGKFAKQKKKSSKKLPAHERNNRRGIPNKE